MFGRASAALSPSPPPSFLPRPPSPFESAPLQRRHSFPGAHHARASSAPSARCSFYPRRSRATSATCTGRSKPTLGAYARAVAGATPRHPLRLAAARSAVPSLARTHSVQRAASHQRPLGGLPAFSPLGSCQPASLQFTHLSHPYRPVAVPSASHDTVHFASSLLSWLGWG